MTERQWQRIFEALDADISDRRGLKSEWRQIDRRVKREILREWREIFDTWTTRRVKIGDQFHVKRRGALDLIYDAHSVTDAGIEYHRIHHALVTHLEALGAGRVGDFVNVPVEGGVLSDGALENVALRRIQ